jgi:pSer/pThr/pTyr-binding forkhead associated (FHA) protein
VGRRPWLRFGQNAVLVTGEGVLIGREASCHVALSDARASRRHARVSLHDGHVLVEDLGSSNGTFVNGERIVGSRWLREGDTLMIGTTQLELAMADRGELRDVKTVREPVVTREAAQVETIEDAEADDDLDDAERDAGQTRRVDALVLIGTLADKALASGQTAAAEQMLAIRLQGVLMEAKSRGNVEPETARAAAEYAVKLAGATGKAEWLNFFYDLGRTLGWVPPVELVDQLYTLVRRLPPTKVSVLREYVQKLQSGALGAADRFVLQRLNGLVQVAASR